MARFYLSGHATLPLHPQVEGDATPDPTPWGRPCHPPRAGHSKLCCEGLYATPPSPAKPSHRGRDPAAVLSSQANKPQHSLLIKWLQA